MSENEQAAAYDVHATEAKWLQVWDELDPFRADDDSPREKRYALTMFPYPSGDLHMGHAEVTALHDVIARYWWQQGYEVMNPIGWDSFGLPAENAAIQRDEHPATYTYANIETQAESFRKYAVSFDWSRRLHTSDPEYYRWTQWLFLKLRERGLAYRKSSPVNWCPNDQTVLANEQVVDGFCERCGAEVTKRELTQWYFKVTDYAQRLLDDMERPGLARARADRCSATGSVAPRARTSTSRSPPTVAEPRRCRVYTTRPDTLFGATFMVVAADAKLAAEIVSDEQRAAYEDYLDETRKASDIDRMATDRPKTGVFLGAYAVNPVNGEQRAGVRRRLRAGRLRHRRDHGRARSGPARLGLREGVRPAGRAHRAAARRLGGRRVHRQRPGDQLRQRRGLAGRPGDRRGQAPRSSTYLEEQGHRARRGQLPAARLAAVAPAVLGLPDPDRSTARSCGEVAVPEDQLPVVLPELKGADLKPKGVSPLAAAEDWVNVDCPQCGGPAKRDSDTMDTFVDSSWYFLRYCSPHDDTQAVRPGRWCASGCRPTSTSAASSTRCCTCCTAGSSPRPCTTWAWSTSRSRSPRC